MPRAERRVYNDATHSRALVAFFTNDRNGPSVETPLVNIPGLGRVTAVTTNKTLGAASGTFTITMKKDAALGAMSALRLWKEPEDVWVQIVFLCDGQPIDTLLGLIDTVNEDTQRSGEGQRAETYTIVGRDFGKVLETTDCTVNYFHDPDQPLRSVGELTATAMEELINTPEGFMRVLLQFWVGNNGLAEQQWKLPDGLFGGSYFSSILSLNQIQEMNRLTHGEAISPSLFHMDQTGGKLWDVMQEYANGVMNELFVDLGPDGVRDRKDLENLTPCIYLRERPFPTWNTNNDTVNARRWTQIRTRTLEKGDVQRRSISKGGAAHRFNYWTIMLEGIGTEGFGVQEILQRGIDGVDKGYPGNIPIYSEESIQLHGLRRYVLNTRFIPYQSSPQEGSQAQQDRENFFRLAGAWLKKVHDWYAVAPFELSGTIQTTRIMPEIRIGERIREVRDEGNIIYYVEGVQHNWSYEQGGRTTLTLTRGEYEEEELLAYVYEQLDAPIVASAPEQCFVDAGTSAEATNEYLDQLARGCAFSVVTTDDEGAAIETASAAGEGFGLGADDENAQLATRTLASEDPEGRGNDTNAFAQGGARDTEMVPAIDDSMPQQVGSAEEISGAGAPAPDTFDQAALERGDDIPLDGLDDVSTISDDPLAGLDL